MIPKFRVWDKENKIMWNIEIWNIEDEYFDLIEPKGDIVRISMRIGKRTTTSIGAVQKRYRLQG